MFRQFGGKRNCKYVYSILLILQVARSVYCDVFIHHFAVHVEGGHSKASRVARSVGLHNKGQIGSLDDHYLFEIPNRAKRSNSPSLEHDDLLHNHPEVIWHEQQVSIKRVKRDFQNTDTSNPLHFIDPQYKDQWYLHGGATGGFDMNVIPAWKKGFSGKNVVITILDDGIERTHTDLIENYDPYASYDVNNHDNDPLPRYDPSNENRHGTRCAGEVAAAMNNTKCGVGVAFKARIGGVKMLDGEVYDAVEANSLSFNRSHIDIYSASWGPDDDGRVVDGPGKLAKKAFLEGIQKGRGGKGSIFVWASGNGGAAKDSCNCDGYTDSIYTLSISSTSEHGTKPWYLEECSSTLATTYSSGAYNERQITTVDLHNRCTSSHTGTSASAPLAAGLVALMLEANPQLTWRDVQYITMLAANPNPMTDGEWVINGLGRKVSLRYGYGLMDASKMVDLALQWTNVPAQHLCEIRSAVNNVNLDGTKYTTFIKTDGCSGDRKVNYIEHVQAQITLSYHRRGDVVLYLTSPMGTRSKILPRRPNDMNAGAFTNWHFLSVHFWGERPEGTWILDIEDGKRFMGSSAGKLITWSLIIYGTAEKPINLVTTAPQSVPPPSMHITSNISSGSSTQPTRQNCHPECVGGCTGPKPEQCIACKHYRNAFGVCVDHCPDSFYNAGDNCQPCDATCKQCKGPTSTNCLQCPVNKLFVQQQGRCVEACIEGTFQTKEVCLPCSEMCRTCSTAPNNCIACYKDYVKKGHICVKKAESLKKQKLHDRPLEKEVKIIIIVISFFLVIVLLVTGLLYLRFNNMWCWSTKYSKLPCSDNEIAVILTETDFNDEDELT
ncbi:furin-like protease kpc-1 isoform X2 [Gigantopelta aegis]|uniref:furin-like protease kpc-1 isoform X2 n=1 Tax=Gigantopelta aegis TaxID=1735272 RepID=UPI001B888C9D|nr:furin-like protease kpc-1 isoform X2 [Gigantopelta aegis]